MDPALQALLEQHKQYFSVLDSGKVKCEVNGHCLPPRLDAVSSFISGAKFQKLRKRYDAENALSKYEPFIVKSKNFPTMLYCTLTVQLIDQSVEAVKKHMQGKKFIRAKERFMEDQQGLKPEPSLSEFDPSLRQPGEGSEDEPEFWVPEGEGDGMDSSEADGARDAGAAGRASSDEQMADVEGGGAAAGGSDGGGDEQGEQQGDKQQGGKAPKRQQQRRSAAAGGAAGGGGSAAGGGRQRRSGQAAGGSGGGSKRNPTRPNPSKKQKR